MAAKRRNPRNKPKEKQPNKYHRRHSQNKHQDHYDQKPHSWASVRSLFTCKYLQSQQQQQKQQQTNQNHNHNLKHSHGEEEEKVIQSKQKYISRQAKTEQSLEEKHKNTRCSGSLCSNTKVANSSNRSIKINTSLYGSAVGSINSASPCPNSVPGSLRNMGLRKLSGCYECRMAVDPVLGMTRDPCLRANIFPCPDCGEIFVKAEILELHQSVRHAVSELGPDDSSKNIVEIIFQSSWLKKEAPVCKIDRILKVQNTSRTISKFEDYRDTIKTRATKFPKKNPRCLADGNELLRFHCTTLMCSLGLNGSSNLCNSIPACTVCSIIKKGFKVTPDTSKKGILTTATSGKAHDSAEVLVDRGKRAMLVCRVIAGRVKRNVELGLAGSVDEYDSLSGGDDGVYSNLDELHVFNPRAILPCFVVIYGGF